METTAPFVAGVSVGDPKRSRLILNQCYSETSPKILFQQYRSKADIIGFLNDVRFAPQSGQRADTGHRRRHGSVRCSDHWLRFVLVIVRLAHRELVWIDATPDPRGGKRKTLGEILEWRFHSALFLACDGRLLQIELALDVPARLVGNFALSQQPVDEFALGGNQVRSKLRSSGTGRRSIAAYLGRTPIKTSLRMLSRAGSCSAKTVPGDQLGGGSHDCTLRDCDCYVRSRSPYGRRS